MRNAALATALSFALVGCVSTRIHGTPPSAAPAPTTTPAAQDAPPADDMLNATVWSQTALERDLVYRTVYRAAAQRLPAALADKTWDALPKEDRTGSVKGLKPAIIVDVDETVLDNAPSTVRQIRDRADFDDTQWGAWVSERKAKPLAGAVEFLGDAAKQGVTVFYITNRDVEQTADTVANLRSAGFPVASDEQVLARGTALGGCAQNKEKSCRRQWVGRTHRVLMQFGDQVGDFVRIAENTPDGRRKVMAPYMDWVGERWFALPNPLYGSWESALFGKDDKTPAQRRTAKEAALDDAK